MPETDLIIQRFEAQASLDMLMRQAGEKTLDGKVVDEAAIAKAKLRVEQLEAAAAVAAYREREAEAARQAVTRNRLADELLDLEAARLGHVEAAERAARHLVTSLNEVLDASGQMRSICRRGQFPPPLQLAESASVVRLGDYLSAVLTRLGKHGGQFGQVRWSSSRFKSADSWQDRERTELKTQLEQSIKETI